RAAGREQPGVARVAAAGRRSRVARRRAANAWVGAELDGGGGGATVQDAAVVERRFPGRVRGARALSWADDQPGFAGAAARPRAGQSGALPVGQDAATGLHPDGAGRPDGDGALDRGTGAVPGP